MIKWFCVFVLGLATAHTGMAQSIMGLPDLTQVDSTTFELTLKTDSAAVISVHVSQDSTYRNAFIFLGRTVGEENKGLIRLERLSNNTHYQYRIFLGTEMTSIGGTFTTGATSKK